MLYELLHDDNAISKQSIIKYINKIDSPPPPPPPVKISQSIPDGTCIDNGHISLNDGCIYNGKTYLNYKNAPDGVCNCKIWFHWSKFAFIIFIFILLYLIVHALIYIIKKIKNY